jgi:hypothetical protein
VTAPTATTLAAWFDPASGVLEILGSSTTVTATGGVGRSLTGL